MKGQKSEIISTSLSQFIWFPRFHHFQKCICSFNLCNFQSIHSMMLQTLWIIQPTYSEHEVKFVTSSPFHLQTSSTVTINLAKAIVKQSDSNNHLHSFTTIPSHLTCYLIYLIHSTKKTLILTSHLKRTKLSIPITIHTANTYINHIRLPNSNVGIQYLIMNISSLFQMFST